jgi:hypothetical protein
MTTKRTDGWRFIQTETVPRTLPDGSVLVLNSVRHTINMMPGRNGFRAWTWLKGKQPRNFVRCECGWSGLPHYASRDHAQSYRCESERVIAAFDD